MDFSPLEEQKRRPVLVDLTPLIDVTFQLLIFFLLTSSYVSPIRDKRASIEIDLPTASAQQNKESMEGFRVSVSESGRIYIDSGDEVSFEELEVRLLELKRMKNERLILISGDRKANYGAVARVLELIQLVGLPASVDFDAGD